MIGLGSDKDADNALAGINNVKTINDQKMDKFDRIQQLHRLLRSHRLPIPLKTLAERMECTEKTVRRTIETLQLQLDAPLEYDSKRKGWHYNDEKDDRFELPGLWLTANELQSLGLLLALLEQVGPGLLSDELKPVEREIDKLLSSRDIEPSAFRERIKILPINHQSIPGRAFQVISEALLQNRQLSIRYNSYNRSQTIRTISPQTLIHYRENWYVDAWCHLRNDLRTFHLSRITHTEVSKTKRKVIAKDQLDAHFASAYGIFAGKAKHTAYLRFDRSIAREIAQQQWHPEQVGEWDGGDYLLTLPYSDDRELVQDILRHCPNVYVEAPVALRRKVQGKLQDTLGRFTGKVVRV